MNALDKEALAGGPADVSPASASPANAEDPRVIQAVEAYLAALEAGHKPDREAFLQQHTDVAGVLAECLDGLQFVRAATPRLQAADADGFDAACDPRQARPLGDFQLLREIGRGGMGIVYEAEQMSLGRRVALKVLPFAAALDAKQLQRFKNEAQAAAHLHHQNIVPVYSVGCERGVHYYAMQYIEGCTLATLIRELRGQMGLEETHAEQRPESKSRQLLLEPVCKEKAASDPCRMAPRESRLPISTEATAKNAALSTGRSHQEPAFLRSVASLGIQAALALEHAHQMGVVHRDIKPANLLLDGRGNLWVTDFGLAQVQSQAGLTLTGDLLGTLRYMSPEQALGQLGVDHRTDLYALGVTLYELLTLEPAFAGRDRQELLRQIAFEEPRPPRRLNKAVPQELETILLKAMAKEPAERYASAQELADDLRRFLEDKPIQARRPNLVQSARKWARRHSGVVATAAVGLVLLVLALAVSNWFVARQRNQRDQALLEKELALHDKDAALAQARENFGEAIKQARLAQEQGLTARRRYYAAQVNLAYQAWESGQVARVLQLLEGQRPQAGEGDLRSFDWYHLWGLCHLGCRLTLRHPAREVWSLAFSPDGTTLASAGNDRIIKLWNVGTGQEWATLRDEDLIRALAFSPDGKTLASVNAHAAVQLWDVVTARKYARLQGEDFLRSVAFSPDGWTVAAGTEQGRIELWDVARRRSCTKLHGHSGPVLSVAFSPNGQMLATASAWGQGGTSDQGMVKLWDLGPSLRRRSQFPGAHSVAFSPDGKTLAAGTDINGVTLLKLFDVQRAQERMSLQGHIGGIYAVAFAADGKTLASAGADRTVRLWDVGTGQERRRLAHLAPVLSLAFSPRAEHLFVSGSEDGSVQLWDLKGTPQPTSSYHSGGVSFLSFSADGEMLVSGGKLQVKLWDVSSGQARGTHAILGRAFALSPNGKTLACWDADCVRLWDLATGRLRDVVPGKQPGVGGRLAFSPDGTILAMDSDPMAIQLWGIREHRVHRTLQLPRKGAVAGLAFSPDGKYLSAAGQFGWVQVWDAVTGKPKPTFPAGETSMSWAGPVSFSPDSRVLACGNDRGMVRLWDVGSGHLRVSLSGHTDRIGCLAFFPDGKTLVTGSADRTIQLWDVATGQERATLKGHATTVSAVTVAPDGSVLASGSDEGTVRFWRASESGSARNKRPHVDNPKGPVVGWESYLERARELLQQARDESVRDSQTLQAMARFAANGPDRRLRDPALAIELARRAIRVAPLEGGSWTALGLAYARAENWQAARVALDKGMSLLRGGECADWFLLATTYCHLGDRSKAQQWYDRADKWARDNNARNEELQRLRIESGNLLGVFRVLSSAHGHQDAVHGLAVSADGRQALSAGFDGSVRLWDVATWSEVRRFDGHEGWVTSVAFSPDDRRAASTGWDKTVCLWEVSSGKLLRQFLGHSGPVDFVAWSPNGRRIVSAAEDQTVRLWDADTGQELHSLKGHAGHARGVAFSPDGRQVLSAGDDKTIRLWDVQTGKELKRFVGHGGAIRSAVFCPDGRGILSASLDRTVRLWDRMTRQEVRRFEGHTGSVDCVAVSRDGRQMLSCSFGDATARLWDLATARELYRFDGHLGAVAGAVFLPQGRRALSCGFADFSLLLWEWPPTQDCP
jgi:WD40 repeat protein/serine/threonine protein kinase